jgi:hypothetical protein
LSKPQAWGLALFSFGITMVGHCGTTSVACFLAAFLDQNEDAVRQRLREWYWEATAKAGTHRQTLEVQVCFADLLQWVLALWPATEPRLALAMDATTLGQRFTVLVLSVLYRGCAIPIAWVVLPATLPGAWQPHWLRLLHQVRGSVPPDWMVLVLTDRGLYADWLYRKIRRLGWHPFMRINPSGLFRIVHQREWQPLAHVVTQPGEQWSHRIVCFKKRSRHCTLMALWAEGYAEPWLILTDLAPAHANTSWYAWRSWIECGFKDLKRGGWQWQHTHMTDPARATRLWLALAVATLWSVSVGGEAETKVAVTGLTTMDLAMEVYPSDLLRRPARSLSCFRRGQLTLVAELLREALLPRGAFQPEPWPTSLPVNVRRSKTYP